MAGRTPPPPSGRCSPSWATPTCWPPGTPTAGCSSSARPTTWLWLRLLKLLLSFIPALVGTIVTVVEAAEGKGLGAIGPGIVAAMQVAVQIAFWLTVTFAIIERTQTAVDLPGVDRRPVARRAGATEASPSPTPSPP